MGYFSELDIERRNAVERRESMDAIELSVAATLLGGEIDGSFIRCPGPGCDPDDRSLFVKFNNGAPYIYEWAGPMGPAYALVRKRLGIEERERRDYTETISRILSETRAGAGSRVERYLHSRALTLPVPPALRFHRLLKHGPTGSWWPVMVAERTDVNGRVTAIHRTYLKHDGSGKADIEPQRMDLGPAQGTAIRLSPICEELMIGEGIETVLSVMQVTGKPGWAAGGMLRYVRLPPEVKSVIILADGDTPGERAACASYARWIAEGRVVAIARAPWGFDFNDVLMGRIS